MLGGYRFEGTYIPVLGLKKKDYIQGVFKSWSALLSRTELLILDLFEMRKKNSKNNKEPHAFSIDIEETISNLIKINQEFTEYGKITPEHLDII